MATELSDKWASQPPEQHIALSQHMIALSMKAVALATLGSSMKDEKHLLGYQRHRMTTSQHPANVSIKKLS